jgi:hypothetical protein
MDEDAAGDQSAASSNVYLPLGPVAAAARSAAASSAANPVLAGGTAGLTAGRRDTSSTERDDGGLGVVRIKPLGAGGGGGERSAAAGSSLRAGVTFSTNPASLTVDGRVFNYPSHVIPPEFDQQALYDAFMHKRVGSFLAGVNVNVMAYGQTGSGKTHTVFGPPGIMARAAQGAYGDGVCADYGLFPHSLLAIFEAVEERRRAGETLVLTGSAVELSVMGNQDMLMRLEEVEKLRQISAGCSSKWGGEALGVALAKSSSPPRLFGMTELPLDTMADVRDLFAALATRNTAGTLMNDSSSRSHCFAFLTLRTHDRQSDTIRTSRFQFVDLAGSERLKDAHGGDASWKEGGEALNGLVTNYSLMQLSTCARRLVEETRKDGGKNFSFKAFIVDLVPLLQESMTGDAATACFVTLSQAPDNLMQSKFALDFCEVFAKLRTRPRQVKPLPRAKLVKEANQLHDEAKAVLGSKGGGGRYRMMRIAQTRDAEQQLELLARFGDVTRSRQRGV